MVIKWNDKSIGRENFRNCEKSMDIKWCTIKWLFGDVFNS